MKWKTSGSCEIGIFGNVQSLAPKKIVLIWLFWTSNVDFEYLKVYEKSIS